MRRADVVRRMVIAAAITVATLLELAVWTNPDITTSGKWALTAVVVGIALAAATTAEGTE